MRPHLPVSLFRSLLSCMAMVCGTTFATLSSPCTAAEEEEEQLLMLLSATYPHGSITYTERQTEPLTLEGYESICFKAILSNDMGGDYPVYGGAIYNIYLSTFTLSNNGAVTFSGNTATSTDFSVGAISNFGTFTLSGNGAVTFSGNTTTATSIYSSAYAGAIYNSGTFTLSGNGTVTFSGNSAAASSSPADGGAIDNCGTFTLSNNGAVTFSGNTATSTYSSAYAGAIYNFGTFTLSGNGAVTFSGNTAYAGAIYNSGTFTLSGNGAVTFSGNTATSTYSSAYGGAIYNSYGTFTLSDNGAVTFSGNTASSSGGAIYNSGSNGTFTLSGNDSVTFSENSAWRGGAISNSGIFTLSGNGDVTFSGNTASPSFYDASGGAIYNDDYGTFSLSSNGNVLFEKNVEITNGTYHLRSIDSVGVLNLSAAAGKNILFRDSVYASGTVNLNQEGTGDIIFTGATIEADLLEVKGSAGTKAEILRSQISQFHSDVALEGGTLQVREGAKLIFDGLAVGSASQSASLLMQNGWVDVANPLTFSDGSSLSLSGCNYLLSNGITAEGNNTLNIQLGALAQQSPALTVVGALANAGNLTINVGNVSRLTGNNYHILHVIGDDGGWQDAVLQLSGDSADALTWVDGDLYYHYNADLLSTQARTDKTITQCLSIDGFEMLTMNKALVFDGASSGITNNGDYVVIVDNGSVTFSGNTGSSGGAIYNSGTFILSGNGIVTFSGYSFYHGGVIYNNTYGTFTLSGNRDVSFSKNTASSGGAIYNSHSFTLRGNASVAFIGNSSSSHGGAIYNSGTFTLSGNGDVSFSGNTASSIVISNGGAIYNSGTFTLRGNGDITFSGNTISTFPSGGAIYNSGTFALSGNGDVLFKKNVEIGSGIYRLRSIYSVGELNLSAEEDKSMLFEDSVYASGTVNLNQEGTGNIIFTGAATESDLLAVKGSAGTKAEILRSQISQFFADVTLSGGSLQVQEGAKLTFAGLSVGSVAQSASLQMQNGWVDVSKPLTFSDGSSLSLSGCNYLLSSGIIAEGHNTLNIQLEDLSQQTTALTVLGALSNAGNLVINVGDVSGLTGNNYHILHVLGNSESWQNAVLQLVGDSADALTWVDGDLYYHYNADLLSTQARTDKTITQRLSIGGFEMLTQNKALVFDGASSGITNNGDYAVILDNDAVAFIGNSTISATESAQGGAIYNSGTFTLSGNASVTFSGNTASTTASSSSGSNAYGGAISNYSGTFTLCRNDRVTFSENTTSSSSSFPYSHGGAIYNFGTFALSENASVTFSRNTTSAFFNSHGGAIYNGGTFMLSGNDSVTFRGNMAFSTVSSKGGAIYNFGIFTLSGNGDVLFEKNVEIPHGPYRLRSIYSAETYYYPSPSRPTLNLSASAGKSILFRDSLYAEGTVNLNQDGTGDIIFTGATTEADLREVKGGVDGTAEEILNSRTSEIATMANLYGGRLIVEDKAVLKGQGITAAADSGATVRVNNGTLDHSGYALTLNKGTTLEAAGASTITAASVNMLSGSTLSFIVGEANVNEAVLTLTGALNLEEGWQMTLACAEPLSGGTYNLLTLTSGNELSGINGDTVKLLDDSLMLLDAYWQNGTFRVSIEDNAIVWAPAGTSRVWSAKAKNWGQETYADGANVVFGNNGSGTVSLSGTLSPGRVTVNNAAGKDYTFGGSGKLAGSMALNKMGAGKLTINNANTYTGGTNLRGGTLVAGNASAFGTGRIALSGGTLNLNGKAVANAITASGGTVSGGGAYKGQLTVEGAVSLSGTLKAAAVNLNSGSLTGGTLSGTTINAANGTLATTLSGNNTLNADNYVLQRVITNSGTLTVSGALDVSALALNTITAAHYDVNGNSGASGFADISGYSVQVVSGGTTVNKGATVRHGALTLTLNSNGTATARTSVVDYGTYLLTGKDTASTAAIHGVNSAAVIGLSGGTLTVDDTATVNATAGNVLLNGGTLNGTVSGTAVTAVSGTVSAELLGSTKLVKNDVGALAVTSANTYSGGTVINGGTVDVWQNNALGTGAVTMNGGTLNLNGRQLAQNSLQVSDEAVLAAGNNGYVKSLTVKAHGVEAAGGKLLHADTLTLSGTLKTDSLHVQKGRIQGGSIAIAGKAEVQQGYVGSNLTGTVLEKKGGGLVELAGRNVFTNGMTVAGGELALLEGGSTSADITVGSGSSLLAAHTVDGHIHLANGAAMYLRPGATYELAGHSLSSAGGTLHGSLNMGGGSATELSGKGLTVTHHAALAGGSLTYADASAQLAVAETLTLAAPTKLSGNWNKTSPYTIMSAGRILNTSGKSLYALFDLSSSAYSLSQNGTTLVLTPKQVKAALARMAQEPQASPVPHTFAPTRPGDETAPAAAAATPRLAAEPGIAEQTDEAAVTPRLAAEQGVAEQNDEASSAATPRLAAEHGAAEQQEADTGVDCNHGLITATAVRRVADCLVQADWGVMNAARMFSASLRQHITPAAERRSAVWAEALGGVTRQSSHGGYAGADTNLTGGAVGVETVAGESATPVGFGFGYMKNRSNTFGMQGIHQESLQLGLYAAPSMQKSGITYSLQLVAAYGRTDSHGTVQYSREQWKQDSLVLSARGNVGTESLSGFAGVEYAATSNGRIDDVRTGAVQNLQGEVGVRSAATVGRAAFYAEAAFTGDMVRHNPGADLGELYYGANPGRLGGRVSVGASYTVSDAWSVHATYSVEGAKHRNSHNAVLGTTYKF